MKKSKLSIGLVTSFIASMALSACGSDVTKNKTNIVDFTGYDGSSLSILIDDIYDDYMKSSAGISKYYDQVMEVLIRNAFQQDKTGSSTLAGVKKNYNQIVNEAKDNVKGAKQTAKQNAETNGTSYKTEWQSILKEKGVKDEEELLQYYIYQLEKEEIEDWYFDKNEAGLKSEYLGINDSGEAVKTLVSSRFPYHIRHILVKVEDGGKDFARGTISSTQAKLLSNTVELLAQGTMSFGEVAQKKSEDTSASSYGDVGLMTNAISGGKLGMVNEFQLGIYAYDAIKKNAAPGNDAIEEGLGLNKVANKKGTAGTDKTAKEYFSNRGIVEVPYSVFKELGDVAELEANHDTGIPVEDGKAAIYPRNLLWNTYLNNHSIFVITNGSRVAADSINPTNPDNLDKTSSASYYGLGKDDYKNLDGEQTIDYSELKGFASVSGFTGSNELVLTTGKNKDVIIGVRSEFGIHLMLVQKSIYDFTDDSKEGVTLEEYYTTAIPGDNDYPVYPEGSTKAGEDKTTYVNFINSVNKSEYNTRADAVRSAIKGFDSTYDYRLYEHLIENSGVDETNEKTKTLLDSIDNYIDLQREKNNNDQEEGIEDVWQTYVELLQAQDYFRKTANRTISEGCKIAFTKNLTDAQKKEYEEGGICYVK